jgi:hypothetical protein
MKDFLLEDYQGIAKLENNIAKKYINLSDKVLFRVNLQS